MSLSNSDLISSIALFESFFFLPKWKRSGLSLKVGVSVSESLPLVMNYASSELLSRIKFIILRSLSIMPIFLGAIREFF